MNYVLEKKDNRKSVLIVDDEEGILEIIEAKLTKYNSKVLRAKDGFDALFKVDNQTFDLILTDIKMPGRDGVFVLEHIRKSKLNCNTPVIAITGHAGEEEVKKLVKSRISAVLVKPIDSDAFMNAVSKFLEIKA